MTGDTDRQIDDAREDRYMIHVHTFNTEVDVADEHQHLMLGVTGPARMEGMTHCHRMRVRTSYLAEDDHGHWHWVDVMTGPPIEVEGGAGHIHYFEGSTSFNDGHCHTFSDVTGLSPDMLMNDDDDDDELGHSHHHHCKCKRPDDEE